MMIHGRISVRNIQTSAMANAKAAIDRNRHNVINGNDLPRQTHATSARINPAALSSPNLSFGGSSRAVAVRAFTMPNTL